MWANIKTFFTTLKLVNAILDAIKNGYNTIRGWLFAKRIKKQEDLNQIVKESGDVIQADKQKPVEDQSNQVIKDEISKQNGVKPGGVPEFPVTRVGVKDE